MCARAGSRSYAKVLRMRYVHFKLVLVSSVLMRILTAGQACLQHYTQPSAEPLPATSSALRGSVLPLGLVSLTHNTASASGMGGRREANGRSAQTTICFKCACAPLHRISYSHDLMGCRRPKLFFMTPQLTPLNVLRQYMHHVLFVPPPPAPDRALDVTAAPMHDSFPFVHKPNTLDDRDRIVLPTGGTVGEISRRYATTTLNQVCGARNSSDLSSEAGIDLYEPNCLTRHPPKVCTRSSLNFFSPTLYEDTQPTPLLA